MDNIINTFIVASIVLKKENKYLLVQEKQPAAYKLWNFPGGKVEKGYTIEQTAIKEAKEESGYDVELIRKIGIFQATTEEPVKHAFFAKIIGGELNIPEEEILDAKWFSFEEIKNMKNKLRSPFIIEGLELLEK